MITWGIDLGGTKIECIVAYYKGSTFHTIIRERKATNASKGYAHILSQIQKLVSDISIETGIKPESLGIATPGICDKYTRTLKNSNVLCLNGKNLESDLKEILKVQVFHANDANCFALAETILGVGTKLKLPPKLTFGIILGSGVGGGIIINGQIYEGNSGMAGEWCHNYLAESSSDCYCGRNGCVESIISGKALEKYYFEISGSHLLLKDIYENYRNSSDINADKTIERLFFYFGKAAAQAINLLDPDLIVIGGGVSNMDVLYEKCSAYIIPFLSNRELKTPILKHVLGDSAGVFGAALLPITNQKILI